jgi:hypothetical protein
MPKKRVLPKGRSKKGSNKGALIKGMSRRLPIVLLGDRSFEDGLQEIMRGYAGIYALYKGDVLYYVGLANNLYGRLRWHTKTDTKENGINSLSSGWDGFDI